MFNFAVRGLITAGVAIVTSIIYQAIRNKTRSICSRCKHIQQIGGFWKYYCDENNGFDKAPKFCYKFEEKE